MKQSMITYSTKSANTYIHHPDRETRIELMISWDTNTHAVSAVIERK
jgi:hypothetical protein